MNDPNRHVGHVVGSLAPTAAVAVANPIGTLLTGLLVVVFTVVALVATALYETRAVWGAYVAAAVVVAFAYGFYRLLRSAGLQRKTAILCVVLPFMALGLLLEYGFLTVGTWVQRKGGFNPTLIIVKATYGSDLSGHPAAREAQDIADCHRDRDSGALFDGSRRRTFEMAYCRGELPSADVERACAAFFAKGNKLARRDEAEVCPPPPGYKG